MRAATALAVAIGLGLALGLLLTGVVSGSSGFADQLAILVIIAAGIYIGWLVAQLTSATLSVVVATILVIIMLTVLFAVKFVRLPSAPLVGDGFELLGAIYVPSGALGAAWPGALAARARDGRRAKWSLGHRSSARDRYRVVSVLRSDGGVRPLTTRALRSPARR